MNSYNIYPGVARSETTVVSVVYSFKDYQELFSPNMDEYKDYLLKLNDYTGQLVQLEPVQLVKILYDSERFSAWLNNNPQWKGAGVEAHCIWAMYAAGEPDYMKNLNSIFPAPPLDEQITVHITYGVVPTLITSKFEMEEIKSRLPVNMVKNVKNILRKFFDDIPKLKSLSEMRCKGIKIIPGTHLVPPVYIEEIEEHLRAVICSDNSVEYALIPKEYRLNWPDIPLNFENGMSAFTPLLFPVVLVGSTSEINYCKNKLYNTREIKGITREVNKTLATLESKIVFLPDVMIDNFIETIIENMNEENPYNECARIKKNHKLKRIK